MNQLTNEKTHCLQVRLRVVVYPEAPEAVTLYYAHAAPSLVLGGLVPWKEAALWTNRQHFPGSEAVIQC